MHIEPSNEYGAEKRAAEQFKPRQSSDWFKIPFKDADLNQYLEEMPKERKPKEESDAGHNPADYCAHCGDTYWVKSSTLGAWADRICTPCAAKELKRRIGGNQ